MKKLIVIPEGTNKRAYLRLASTINTLWNHAKKNGYPVAMLTAFRGLHKHKHKMVPRYTMPENLKRNELLKEMLEDLPVSYVNTEGVGYIEGYGTKEANPVDEKSFFVIGNLMPEEEFKKKMMELGHRFYQDSILYKPGDSDVAYFLGTQDVNEEGERVSPGYGKMDVAGKFHPSKIGDFYSKMRGHPFTFTAKFEPPVGRSSYWHVAVLQSNPGMLR